MKGSNKLLKVFLNLLYPKVVCPICREIHEGICMDCRISLKSYDECGLHEEGRGVSMFHHKEQSKTLISNFKKKMMFSAGDVMAELIFERYGDELKNFDVITFAPSSKESRKKLGFDHGRYLACVLSQKTGVPVVPFFTASDKEQKLLDREERAENAKKIRLRKGKILAVKGKKAVLIDDVYTTGSTVHRCIELLEELGMECRYLTFSRL